MLGELFQYLTTTARSEAKKLGYVYSSIALESRFKRCQSNWAPHIDHCHRFIRQNIPGKSLRIAVIGSGLLAEIPWQELVCQGHHLTLFDVVHPDSVKKSTYDYSQILLKELDITGFSKKFLKEKPTPENYLDFFPPELERRYDFVISANILSQLSIQPIEYLEKKNSTFKLPHLQEALSQKMGNDHWAWIQTLAPRGLLFTDVERKYLSPEGELLETHPSSFVLPESSVSEWDWNISPLGELSSKYSMMMTVKGYLFEGK